MTTTEQFNDWLIRYNVLLKKRYSKRQKQRFLQSFLTDLTNIRKDVALRKDKKDKDSFHIVVGDLKNAKHVIATYYDTPAIYQGDYAYFDIDKQRKSTTNLLIGLSLTMLVLGVVFTYFVGIPIFGQGGVSFPVILLGLFYFIFFYVFGKVTRGWPEKANLMRNTSSLLYLLQMVKNNDPSIAYVFYDHGCQGETSILKVRKKLDLNKQHLTILDSVGAEGELVRVAKNQLKHSKISTIISKDMAENCEYLITVSKVSEDVQSLALDKTALKAKKINEENYQKLNEFFN